MTSEKWRPLLITLIVIAAIFSALLILEVMSGGMGSFHGGMMNGIASWSHHIGGCMR